MTVGRRPHVGWEVRCDAIGCTATTAGTPGSNRSADHAQHTAAALLWLLVRVAGHDYWVCPLQQTRDPRLERWVPVPGIIRTAA